MKSLFTYIILTFFINIHVVTIMAQESCLDASFGDDGFISYTYSVEKVTKFFLPYDSFIYSIETVKENSSDFYMKKLRHDGRVDEKFNLDKSNIVSFEKDLLWINKLYHQPDGKMIARLDYKISKKFKSLLKFNADGSVDSSFGRNGIAVAMQKVDSAGISIWKEIDFGDGGLSMLADGKFILWNIDIFSSKTTLLRLNADGSVDTSFGKDGYLTIGRYNPTISIISDIVSMPDGRMVIGGRSFNTHGSTYNFFFLMRLHADGSVDSTFSGKGELHTNFGMNGLLYSRTLAVQADGKIVIGGNIGAPIVARFLPDGRIDKRFNGQGYKFIEDSLILEHLHIHNGQYILAGRYGEVGYTSVFVSVMEKDGSIDSSFCDNGMFKYFGPLSTNNTLLDFYTINNHIYINSGYGISSPRTYISLFGRIYWPAKEVVPDAICPVVYPNPSYGDVYIQQSAARTYQVVDALGRVVLSGSLVQGYATIPMHQVSTGMYFLTLYAEDGTSCQEKIVRW